MDAWGHVIRATSVLEHWAGHGFVSKQALSLETCRREHIIPSVLQKQNIEYPHDYKKPYKDGMGNNRI